jgi:hypothetical protein
VLFRQRFWAGLADGSITQAYRRFKRPTVKAGGSLQSPGGQLAILEVAPVAVDDISAADARAAGFDSRAALLRELGAGEGPIFRVRFRREGEDPRVALRADTDIDADALNRRLDRMDGSAPWTRQALAMIAAEPGRRAADLAPRVGMAMADFKTRIRRLKALGLTESLEVGYRLSPRGRKLLER